MNDFNDSRCQGAAATAAVSASALLSILVKASWKETAASRTRNLSLWPVSRRFTSFHVRTYRAETRLEAIR